MAKKPIFGNALQTILNEVKTTKVSADGRLSFEHYTKKEIAARLGVSTRTLRRWTNEGRAPSAAHAETVQKEGKRARRRIVRHGGAVIKGVAVPGHRRQLKEYENKYGRPVATGKTYASPWVNYDTSNLTLAGVFEVAKHLRDTVGYIQFIYRVNAGAEKGRHGSTGPRDADVRFLSDSELWELILRVLYQYVKQKEASDEDEDEDDDEGEESDTPNTIMYIGANAQAVSMKTTHYR